MITAPAPHHQSHQSHQSQHPTRSPESGLSRFVFQFRIDLFILFGLSIYYILQKNQNTTTILDSGQARNPDSGLRSENINETLVFQNEVFGAASLAAHNSVEFDAALRASRR
jgi:hypothetical protein